MDKEIITSLVEKSKAGDQKAFEELLYLAHTPVSYKCRKMIPDSRDAEDLTQEILMVVYQKLDTLENSNAFWKWLQQITTTRCINALNRTHHDLQFAEDEEGNSVLDNLEEIDEHQIPDKAIDNAETVRMIDEIVAKLPEAQKITTLMYYYDELSVKEIAQIMGVPENTVKSRLNLARKTIKNHVEEYEKQGVKLYSISVLPFLWYFLRNAAQLEANTSAASACVVSVISSGAITTTTTSATVATTTGVSIVGNAATNTTGILAGKLIAGIVAAAVIIGGGVIAVNNLTNDNDTVINTGLHTATTSSYAQENGISDTVKNAYTAYEELLTKGVTDQDLQINYYAYLDLNQDGIPELLVADADGTPDSWSVCELYTYRDSTINFCGSTNSRYDYFYHVNDTYLMGCHRMGNQFISVDGFMDYPREKLEHYNIMPGENSENGFIEKAEPIKLIINEFCPISNETALQMFNYAKSFYDYYIYGRRFIDVNAYSVETFDWIDGVLEYQGGWYEPVNDYTYEEFVNKLHTLFTDDAVEALIQQTGLIEHNGRCYTYIREGVGAPCLGYEAKPVLTNEDNYTIQITITEMDESLSTHQIDCRKVDNKWLLTSGQFYGR